MVTRQALDRHAPKMAFRTEIRIARDGGDQDFHRPHSTRPKLHVATAFYPKQKINPFATAGYRRNHGALRFSACCKNFELSPKFHPVLDFIIFTTKEHESLRVN